MPFDRAKTSLGFLEEKFRKLFGLAGTIGASFEPSITPVVVAADCRDPGVASFKGRHWAWQFGVSIPTPTAANVAYGLQWPVAGIVRGLQGTGLGTGAGGGDEVIAFLLAPDSPEITTWGGGNRQTGRWIDQTSLDTEATPLVDRALGVAVAALATNPHQRAIAYWVSGTQSYTPISLHSPANGAILFQPNLGAGAIRCRFAMWGEIA